MYAFFLFGSLALASDIIDVWVQTNTSDERATLQSLGLGFVEEQDGNWLRMHADIKRFDALSSSGLTYRYARREMLHESGYLSPEEMVDALTELAEDHPSSAQLVHLGWSVEDRPVLGLRISHTDSPARRVRILGAHHGDETASAEVALQTARDLLLDPTDSYAAWLDQHEVWVVPHVNPDGIAELSRYNANNVDLNRNYGFMWSESEFRPGDAPFSEPETRNIRAMGAWIPAGLGLSVHAGAINLGWVWNFTTDLTADEELLEHIATAYAEDCTTEDFWITNGAEWYITNGDTTDWSYGRYGTLDFTLEVSTHKHPNSVRMDHVRTEHSDAIQQVIRWPWWIAGQVINQDTRMGIPAVVTIEGIDQPIVTGPDGRFSRPISEDVAGVSIDSPGFASVELEIDPDGDPVEISLTPLDLATTEPTERILTESGIFTLTDEATSVVLGRPGHESRVAARSGTDWQVDPDRLQPGPWDLTIDGEFAPRALFVRERDDRVRVSGHWTEEDWLYISIDGLNQGLHAWALVGTHRSLLPMTVENASEDTVRLDTSSISPGSAYDLMIWHSGRQLFILNAHLDGSLPDEDTEGPTDDPEDTGTEDGDGGGQSDSDGEQPEDGDTNGDNVPRESDSNSSDPVSIVGENAKLTSGCNTAPGYPAYLWLVSLLGLTRMRSGQCIISRPS